MKDLAGLKALIVEDESSVAMLIEDMLEMFGCQVEHSVASVAKACDIARTAVFDFALLDVNLAGEPVFPVARILRERGVPFVFSTGYGQSGVPDDFKSQPTLSKPFGMEELRRVLLATLA